MRHLSLLLIATLSVVPVRALAELPAEPVPNVTSLTKKIPDGWLYAHDVAFFSLTSGKVFLIDPKAETRNLRAIIRAGQFATFAQSKSDNEIYVAESFFSRGTRGDQVDVLTIYDTTSMHKTGEIILPTGKRFQVVTQPAALQLTRDEKFILVFNFTPASSVTVIDRQKRKIVNEIDVPGCMLIYPQGRRGFATLCNDGSLLSMALDRTGKPSKPVRSAVFNNIDEDPLFMKPAWIDKKLYLASYMGGIQSVDLKGKKAKIDAMWRIPSNHRDALQNAKPSGWQVIATDSEDRIYVLMRTAACFRGNFYMTGDRATRDEDGYFWFVGRSDDVILSAGYRIGPFEVESVLFEHPAVAESAVVASPDPVRGEVVKAFIVLAGGYTASDNLVEELQNYVKGITAPYKYPRKIEFIDELPKTVSGKIRRKQLKQQEWADLPQS